MLDYLANFSGTGDPNGSGLPAWNKTGSGNSKVLCFRLKDTKMGRPSYLKLTKNMITKGAPKG